MATEGKTGWRKGWLVLLVLIALIVAGGAFLLLPQLRERDKLYYSKGKLNLDAGNSVAALENFRTALKLNPQFLEAQVGVVQALAARRDFADAQTALAKAVEMGYPKGESAMLKAKLLADRATYRLDSAADHAGPRPLRDGDERRHAPRHRRRHNRTPTRPPSRAVPTTSWATC